ncbi:LOW QUALITY PROTEIN: UDP-glucose:glycoprotein glucosyltransferase 1-like, partial [Diaphorina citri]|uniref:LOW QUALITY PROTEIN: UDP-glucose:glycoprotein glucosyltransferase 1-like n=1 Tax=Diaphorina citri TaxID=121845 RepID=A0A3Q0J0T0_DIACI
LRELYPDQKASLSKFRNHLLESTNEMAPLKVWQFQDLSQQAAQRILDAPVEDQLHTLIHIAQNFPVQARSLVSVKVTPEFRAELKHNQDLYMNTLSLGVSEGAMYVNGLYFDVDLIDMAKLLETVRHELSVMQGLYSIGITDDALQKLLCLDLSPSSKTEYGLDIRDSAVQWINDIEQDKKYSRWSYSLMDLLRPTFPGMLRNIKRNLYSLVIICDPSKKESIPLLKLIESFYVHSAPLRIGLVFNINPSDEVTGLQDAGVAMLNVFNYIGEIKKPHEALATDMTSEKLPQIYSSTDKDRYERALGEASRILSNSQLNLLKLSLAMHSDSPRVEMYNQIALQRGVKCPVALDVGDALLCTLDSLENTINSYLKKDKSSLVRMDTFRIDHQYPGCDNSSLTLILYGELGTPEFAQFHAVLEKYAKRKEINYIVRHFVKERQPRKVRLSGYGVELQMKSTEYKGHVCQRAKVKPQEDVSVEDVINAFAKEYSSVDVDEIFGPDYFINNCITDDGIPSKADVFGPLALLRIVLNFNVISPHQVYAKVKPQEDVSPEDVINAFAKEYSSVNVDEIFGLDCDYNTGRQLSREFIARTGLVRKTPQVLMNGIPLPETSLTAEDFEEAILTEIIRQTPKFQKAVYKGELTDSMDVAEYVMTRPNVMPRLNERVLNKDRSTFIDLTLPPSDEMLNLVQYVHAGKKSKADSDTLYMITHWVVVDLNSTDGRQLLDSTVEYLKSEPGSRVAFLVNPASSSDEVKGQHFAFLAALHAGLDVEKSVTIATQALTQAPASIPELKVLSYDLNNIKLKNVDSNVHSEYELEFFIIQGHCFESVNGNPPRGLQMTLGTEQDPVQVDTIVMANLGYFQLKANPGAWILRLRQGRSSEIYDITHHAGSDTPVNSTDIKILISSFKSHILDVKVTKKPDKLNVDLLAEDSAENGGLWNSITSTFGGKEDSESGEERINIFSVASGHLYERFLRIMMLSVLKHTKTPVKFWFLKNYLSPTLKDFLPRMAKAYKFEYELVQYKWPRWLTQQTEKQRIIWGYKILFLDVLFPLDVKKIIFVDADQV